jgi:hypothetical protein
MAPKQAAPVRACQAPLNHPPSSIPIVLLKSHQDGSPHTIRVYKRVGERFLGALAVVGSNLRKATVEDVQAALAAMRTKEGGSPVRPATVNTYVAPR